MELPKLRKRPVERDMISAFGGIQRTASVPEGKFADMMNLTSDHAPVMAVRSPRRIETLSGSVTGMAGSDDLYYVVQGKMYRKSYPTGTISQIMSGLSTTLDTEIVLMSGYVLALGLGQHQVVKMTGGLAGTQEDLAKSVSGQFSYSPCTLDGTVIQPEKGSTPPAAPADGSYWVDTSHTPNVLKQWAASDGIWTSVSTAYVKIGQAGLGNSFSVYDGVDISSDGDFGGLLTKADGAARYSSSFVVMDKSTDFLIVSGLCDEAGVSSVNTDIKREIPSIRYAVESGNRVWACSVDGHEIYASKLGDPYNWNCYLGVSTDSYAATVGSPGNFTGAAAYGGTVYFFKENCIIQVRGTQPSNFQVNEIPCQGVQKGSARSLCVIDGMLFYKSRTGVCRYDGSLPVEIAEDLGEGYYHSAAAGTANKKYYLSMLDAQDQPHLFVYDLRRGCWHKEDGLRMKHCASMGGELFAAAIPEGGAESLVTLNYDMELHSGDLAGVREKQIPFLAETGDWGVDSPDQKYVSQVQLRCELDEGAQLCMDIEYDSDGNWHRVADMTLSSKRTFTLPITLRRCDHFRMRLSGAGGCRVFSIARTLERGGMTGW